MTPKEKFEKARDEIAYNYAADASMGKFSENIYGALIEVANWAYSYMMREYYEPLLIECDSWERDVERLQKEVDALSHALNGFLEYFDAIAKGEYKNNGRDQRIRTFEQVLIDRGHKALKTTGRQSEQ